VNIVAVDPGKTCGLAFLYPGHPESFGSREFDRWGAVRVVDGVAEIFPMSARPDLVVCESFVPRPGVRTWQPEALETIGALRYVCDRAGVPFETQSPADAKRFSNNRKLELLGWRKPTPGGHADDAARHLLLAAVRHGVIDPAQFL
jgi:hypothetical protein